MEYTFFDVIKTGLALVALITPPARYFYNKWRTNRGDMSWRAVKKAILKLKKQLDENNITPKCIVGVGRAGAIAASVLSHQFGTRYIPIVVLNFAYEMRLKGGVLHRVPIAVDVSQIKEGLEDVLLLGADIMSGGTMVECMKVLDKRNCDVTAIACLFLNSDITLVQPKYFVEKRAKRPQYPWMPIPHEKIFEKLSLSAPYETDSKQVEKQESKPDAKDSNQTSA
ncbi:MAG: phosphoribosyltransferase [Acidobacteriota bacterium]|nr:phosphoribosyltransferase [Acidobacteriota bacterium]